MEYTELLKKKKTGDWVIVGKMVDETPMAVQQSFKRPKAKKHNQVVEALTRVIEMREQLLTNK